MLDFGVANTGTDLLSGMHDMYRLLASCHDVRKLFSRMRSDILQPTIIKIDTDLLKPCNVYTDSRCLEQTET